MYVRNNQSLRQAMNLTDNGLDHHYENCLCAFFGRVSGTVADCMLSFDGEKNRRGEIVHVLGKRKRTSTHVGTEIDVCASQR